MKSLLLLIVLTGTSFTIGIYGLGVFLLVEDQPADSAISFAFTLAAGITTWFVFNGYKKMNWKNDFMFLFIKTRINRSSQKIKSAKDKMRRELDHE